MSSDPAIIIREARPDDAAAFIRYFRTILAEPVINQGVLAFRHPSPSAGPAMHDAFTEQVIARINAGGRAFFQPSTFRGRRCMRISVSGWRTTVKDVEMTVAAIAEALDAEVTTARQA